MLLKNITSAIREKIAPKESFEFFLPTGGLVFKQTGGSYAETRDDITNEITPAAVGARIPYLATQIAFRANKGRISLHGANTGNEFDSASAQWYGKQIEEDADGTPMQDPETGSYVLREDAEEKGLFFLHVTHGPFVSHTDPAGFKGGDNISFEVQSNSSFAPRIAYDSTWSPPTKGARKRNIKNYRVDDGPTGTNGQVNDVADLCQLILHNKLEEFGIEVDAEVEQLQTWVSMLPEQRNPGDMANVKLPDKTNVFKQDATPTPSPTDETAGEAKEFVPAADIVQATVDAAIAEAKKTRKK